MRRIKVEPTRGPMYTTPLPKCSSAQSPISGKEKTTWKSRAPDIKYISRAVSATILLEELNQNNTSLLMFIYLTHHKANFPTIGVSVKLAITRKQTNFVHR